MSVVPINQLSTAKEMIKLRNNFLKRKLVISRNLSISNYTNDFKIFGSSFDPNTSTFVFRGRMIILGKRVGFSHCYQAKGKPILIW